MKIALPNLRTSHLSANEEALRRCQDALELKDKEDYKGAQDAMQPLWQRVGERPKTEGLHPSVVAEVFLCVGILTSWIGSRNQIKDAQETAKNLITESITYFESIGDVMRIAAARTEIAYCYWRQGELNEARTLLHEALKKLTTEGATRARALLKLTTVEWTAGRYYEALGILTDNAKRLHLKWLNRRSQRQSYNWAGYRALMQHFTLERPRIAGRPRPCRLAPR